MISEYDISVIVPCYNANRYLNVCLESLKAQRSPQIEMIFIDDGSTDSTGAMLDAFARTEPRAKVIHERNEGVSAARNRGIAMAKGRYIAFMDADDALEEKALSTLFQAAVRTGAQITSANHTLFDMEKNCRVPVKIDPVVPRPSEIVREIIHMHRIYNNLWNKLYVRELFADGLNVSPLVLNCTKDKNAALDAFAALVRHILDTSDDAVALIPHVTWAHDNDLDALHAIKARFADEERVFILPGTLNALQYKGYVKRLRALVTARTHVSIAAYSTCVPTLVIGYSVKARGIARDLFGNEDGHLIPAQELSGERELIAAYDAMLAREVNERAHLQARMPEYTAGGERLIADILALGGKSR